MALFSLEDFDFGDVETNKKCFDICNNLNMKREFLGMGRNRIVFGNENYVIKFPLNGSGEIDNCWEGSLYESENPNPEDVQYPYSRRIEYKGFVCCMMERVFPVRDYKNLPDWTMSVDCCQVGYNNNKRLVAYDYGFM